MLVFEDRNVNHLYAHALWKIGATDGSPRHQPFATLRDSRNGPMLEFNEPVTSVYLKPTERVLFSHVRDANPFFHLHESLWMLAGRDDVASVAGFASNIANYSDNGTTFYGAYRMRWRQMGDPDQLQTIIKLLKENPDDRRAVLQMWNAALDLDYKSTVTNEAGKDVPCNTVAYFKVRDGKLNMLVSNRSNDLIWGCYGANAVHFSYLQEYIAAHVGVQVGVYRQVSDSLHAYVAEYEKRKNDTSLLNSEPYVRGSVVPFPINHDCTMDDWDKDLVDYMNDEGPEHTYQTDFFQHVAEPMRWAFRAWKQSKDYAEAYDWIDKVRAEDWQLAGRRWLGRRQDRAALRIS